MTDVSFCAKWWKMEYIPQDVSIYCCPRNKECRCIPASCSFHTDSSNKAQHLCFTKCHQPTWSIPDSHIQPYRRHLCLLKRHQGPREQGPSVGRARGDGWSPDGRRRALLWVLFSAGPWTKLGSLSDSFISLKILRAHSHRSPWARARLIPPGVPSSFSTCIDDSF